MSEHPTVFLGFDHLDVRVSSLAAVEQFYDLLMPALGLPVKRYAFVAGDEWRTVTSTDIYNAVEYVQSAPSGTAATFIGIIEDLEMQATRTRVAFPVPDPASLQTWVAFLTEIKARDVELSSDFVAYPAVFFEDPAETKWEICARRSDP
ncbi:MAG: VOC family protein [Candidatus Eremiobacteraeota bacterium]|nr:VOC family protein [Candidatus Eremiobacteraeota bacterium]